MRFSDAERTLIASALMGLALDGDRTLDGCEIPCDLDGDCRCFPLVYAFSVNDGIVEEIAGPPRMIVDVVLDHVESLRTSERPVLDASGIPTAGCPNCGEQWLNVPMVFDDESYDVAGWALEGECFSCGTKVTVCCPVDKMHGG